MRTRVHAPHAAGARLGGVRAHARAREPIPPACVRARRHLEGCLCAAASLGSEREYATWARSYALALAQARDERRARELCEALLAAVAEGGGVDDGVFGATAARKLLSLTVLPALATNRALQRLVEMYSGALRDERG
jgi:hypothetical protein